MTVQIEFWQLITLLLAFLGFLFAAGRLLLSQIDRRLDGNLDAESLDEVARVHLPRRVPLGFHGAWLPDAP